MRRHLQCDGWNSRPRHAVLVALILLGGSLSCSGLQDAARADQPSVAHAERLAAQGRIEQALAEAQQLEKENPAPDGIERLIGYLDYQQNKLSEADLAFSKALARNPDDSQAMQMRGAIQFRLGHAAAAIPFLEKAHTIVNSANVDPNYVLGLCYIDTERYDDARRAFSAQYGFPPDSAPAYLLAARMFFRHHLVAIAEQFVRKALALNPNLPLANQLFGEIALAREDVADAIQALQKEREISPLNGEVYDRLGDAYMRAGRFAEAQESLNRAILLEPNSSVPYILLGNVMLSQQNPVVAGMYLQHALSIDPDNSMAHFLLARTYTLEGKRSEADAEFKKSEALKHLTPAGGKQ